MKNTGSMASGSGSINSQLSAAGHGNSNSQARTRSSMPSSAGTASDNINSGVLKHLEGVFRSADSHGSGQLDMEEFVTAFKGVINTPEGSDDEALRKLFMKIDANCDATIDWTEFSAYLLLEKTTSTGAAAGPAGAAGSGIAEMAFSSMEAPATSAAAAHKDLVSAILHVDNGMGPDKWYSTGREGTIKSWNGKDLAPLKTLQTPLQSITCSTYLPHSNLLALGSYTSSLLLLDPASGEQAGKLSDAASSAALSVTAWQEEGDVLMGGGEGREMVAVGDADGGVNLMQIVPDGHADRKSKSRFQGKLLWRAQNHHDWVVQVLHMAQLNSILAASLDKKLSMTDIERAIAVKTLQGHDKSVTCCGWSGLYKMAISGSEDKTVMLWNPFSCRPMGTLTGHAAGIVAMAVNEKDHHIVTAASDKVIKVWDLRNQRCLQTLTDPATYYPEDTLSALTYSPARNLLVSGSYCLKGWPLTDSKQAGGMGHRDSVSWVGYNNMFSEAVSADHAGMVCVWHVPTGRLRSCFGNTHNGARISAATFDNNHRRLITGAEDGSVKVWNFSSGVLLSSLAVPDYSHDWGSGSGAEVTGLAVSSSNQAQSFIVTGWDRKVTWYDDCGKRVSKLLRSSSGPTSDVLTAALMEGYPTLATACYDGEIWLWNLDSGAVRRRLLIPGHSQKPESEQPVEKLAFMHGDYRHVLVAVGADRVMRFWDCFSGACLAETFTGHQQGESVAALALAPDNKTAVTADTAGYIMVWDISGLKLPSVSRSQARPSTAAIATCVSLAKAAANVSAPGICRVAVWRGHQEAVTALDWIPAPTTAAAEAAVNSARLTAAAAAATEGLVTETATASAPAAPAVPTSSASEGAAIHCTSIQHIQQQQQQQQQPEQQQPQQLGPGLHTPMRIPQQQKEQHCSVGYIVSASLDKTLALWSSSGALVGVFGRHSWGLENLDSWQSKTRTRLRIAEEFDMLVSARAVEVMQCASQEPMQPSLQQTEQLQQGEGFSAQPQDVQASGTASVPTILGLSSHSSRRLPVSAGFVKSRRINSRPASAGSHTHSAMAEDAAIDPLYRPRGSCSSDSAHPSRPVSASSRFTSRPVSGVGSLQGPQQQQQRSKPASPPGGLAHSSSASPQTARVDAGSPNAAACPEPGTSEGRMTPRSVALVCQISMKQRANVLKTLGSIKQQCSHPDGDFGDGNNSSSSVVKAREVAGLWGAEGSCEEWEEYVENSSESIHVAEDQYTLVDESGGVFIRKEQQHPQENVTMPGAYQLQQQQPAQQLQQQSDPKQQQLERAVAAAKSQQLSRPASAGPVVHRTRCSRVGFSIMDSSQSCRPSAVGFSGVDAIAAAAVGGDCLWMQNSASECQQAAARDTIACTVPLQPADCMQSMRSPQRPAVVPAAVQLLQTLQQRPSSATAKQRPSSAAFGGRLAPHGYKPAGALTACVLSSSDRGGAGTLAAGSCWPPVCEDACQEAIVNAAGADGKNLQQQRPQSAAARLCS